MLQIIINSNQVTN